MLFPQPLVGEREGRGERDKGMGDLDGAGGGKGETCWGALGNSSASWDQYALDDREYVRNICTKYDGEVRLLRSECPMAGVCSWELRGELRGSPGSAGSLGGAPGEPRESSGGALGAQVAPGEPRAEPRGASWERPGGVQGGSWKIVKTHDDL